MSIRNSFSASITALLLVMVTSPSTASGATMRIIVRDGAGVGFNDPGPPDASSTAGGNSGATIGAQRLNALQHAADIWGALLESSVDITIDAQFGALACVCRDSGGNVVACNSPSVASFSATAGIAAPITVAVNFANAPKDLTVYAAALANSLAGADLNAQSDINATFNNVFG